MGRFFIGMVLTCAAVGAVMYYAGDGVIAFVIGMVIGGIYSALVPMGGTKQAEVVTAKQVSKETRQAVGDFCSLNVPDHEDEKPKPPDNPPYFDPSPQVARETQAQWAALVARVERREAIEQNQYQPGVQVPLPPVNWPDGK
jgi:hypothetical protein